MRVAGLYTRRFGPWPPVDPVVLVHGLGLSGRYFTRLARTLAPARTVLVPDLPGNARSRRAARHMPDTAATAEALRAWHAALGIGPCALVANSVGCQVAVAFAARHPALVRGLVLIGPALDATRLSAWRQLAGLVADAPRERFSLLAVAVTDYLVTGPLRFLAAYRHARRDAAEAFTTRLRHVTAPVLVVRGAADPVAPDRWARQVAAGPSRGHCTVVPGAAHAVHHSRPDATARLVEEFLREARETPA